MPITIQRDSLFKQGFSINYITGWDNNFKKDKYTGILKFYNGNPLYVVDVQILADRNKLREEDILITVGELHNATNIEDMINKHTNIIYEMCKSSVSMGFVLDLGKMKILEVRDFSESLPIFGLNTLFMFENIRGQMFCLVNPAKNVNSNEFFAWFTSYIYSMFVCLSPRDKIENYSKKFLQAISGFALTGGKTTKVSNKATVLDCGLNDLGELLLPVPGNNTKRFEHLVENSIDQMAKQSGKAKNDRLH